MYHGWVKMKAIEAEGLHFGVNGYKILKGIDIDIDDGEFISILGPNGAGKTTLIKVLLGLYRGDDGDVYIFGKRLKSYRKKDLAKIVSFLPQSPSMDIPFQVRDIVMMGRAPYIKRFEFESRRDREAAEYAMELLNISHLASRHLVELSGGEVKRVFIAQALAQESRILFLDEPTANLDIKYQVEIFNILKNFNEKLKKTVVLITHDINHAARFAREIMLMKDGKILKRGSPSSVINENIIKETFGIDVEVKIDELGKPYILI